MKCGVRIAQAATTLAVLALGFWVCACTRPAPYVPSDHYDGKHFYNATPSPKQSIIRLAHHIAFGRTGKWPKSQLKSSDSFVDCSHALAETDVAVTFINHATVLVQTKNLTIITDPVWSERVGPVSWAGPRRARTPGVELSNLPDLDFVLISHNHFDHLDLPTLQKLAHQGSPRFLVPLGDAELLRSANIENVVELDWWQEVPGPENSAIVFAPARHNSGRSPFAKDKSLWGSFLILDEQRRIYFAGDTAYSRHFEQVRERYGPIDVALLPIGAYLPRDLTAAFHLDPNEAVQAHSDLGAKLSIGIHFGTFQLTAEDFDAPMRDLKDALKNKPGLSEPFLLIDHGKTQVFSFSPQSLSSEISSCKQNKSI